MFDVILHGEPLPASLHARPKRYFTAQGDAAPKGMTRMTEKELRKAIDDTEPAFQDFLDDQAYEAPSLPAVYVRDAGGVTHRLVVDEDGMVLGVPLTREEEEKELG